MAKLKTVKFPKNISKKTDSKEAASEKAASKKLDLKKISGNIFNMKKDNTGDADLGENVKISFFSSIRFRLIAAFLVPILCIIVLGVISYNTASNAISESYTDQTLQTAEVINKYIDLIIESDKEEMKTYLVDQNLTLYFKGSLDKTKSALAVVDYRDALNEKLNVNENLSDMYFISDEGRSIAAHTGANVVDDAYSVFMASAEGEALDANSGNWVLFGADEALDEAMGLNKGAYAFRYVRKLGNQKALIIIDFSAEAIRNTLSIMDAGDEGYVMVVTTDGKEFYSDAALPQSNLVYGQTFYNNAISSGEASGISNVALNGKDYLFVFSKIGESDNMVAALIPLEMMTEKTSSIKHLTMIIAAIAAILGALIAIVISGKMAGTIGYILGKLNKVADGDLTTTLKVSGKDEFSLLCTGINRTVGKVKDLMVEVNEVGEKVEDAAKNMSAASQTFKATSDDIRKSVREIEDSNRQMEGDSGVCLDAMDNLSDIISEVKDNTDEIRRLTSTSGQTIQKGMDSVQNLTESAEDTRKITEDVINAIRELEEKLSAVHNIVDAINKIAGQTNLLSLNASIEAARAGEAGRGFAVVATEVRELSNQCMEAANKITVIVNEVSSQTGNVVKIAEKAETVVENQYEAVELTGDSFDQILKQVSGLIESINTIHESVNKMDASRTETLKSIKSISETSNEMVSSAATVDNATERQADATENLDDATAKLGDKSEELLNILGTFKI